MENNPVMFETTNKKHICNPSIDRVCGLCRRCSLRPPDKCLTCIGMCNSDIQKGVGPLETRNEFCVCVFMKMYWFLGCQELLKLTSDIVKFWMPGENCAGGFFLRCSVHKTPHHGWHTGLAHRGSNVLLPWILLPTLSWCYALFCIK